VIHLDNGHHLTVQRGHGALDIQRPDAVRVQLIRHAFECQNIVRAEREEREAQLRQECGGGNERDEPPLPAGTGGEGAQRHQRRAKDSTGLDGAAGTVMGSGYQSVISRVPAVGAPRSGTC